MAAMFGSKIGILFWLTTFAAVCTLAASDNDTNGTNATTTTTTVTTTTTTLAATTVTTTTVMTGNETTTTTKMTANTTTNSQEPTVVTGSISMSLSDQDATALLAALTNVTQKTAIYTAFAESIAEVLSGITASMVEITDISEARRRLDALPRGSFASGSDVSRRLATKALKVVYKITLPQGITTSAVGTKLASIDKTALATKAATKVKDATGVDVSITITEISTPIVVDDSTTTTEKKASEATFAQSLLAVPLMVFAGFFQLLW